MRWAISPLPASTQVNIEHSLLDRRQKTMASLIGLLTGEVASLTLALLSQTGGVAASCQCMSSRKRMWHSLYFSSAQSQHIWNSYHQTSDLHSKHPSICLERHISCQ